MQLMIQSTADTDGCFGRACRLPARSPKRRRTPAALWPAQIPPLGPFQSDSLLTVRGAPQAVARLRDAGRETGRKNRIVDCRCMLCDQTRASRVKTVHDIDAGTHLCPEHKAFLVPSLTGHVACRLHATATLQLSSYAGRQDDSPPVHCMQVVHSPHHTSLLHLDLSQVISVAGN